MNRGSMRAVRRTAARTNTVVSNGRATGRKGFPYTVRGWIVVYY